MFVYSIFDVVVAVIEETETQKIMTADDMMVELNTKFKSANPIKAEQINANDLSAFEMFYQKHTESQNGHK